MDLPNLVSFTLRREKKFSPLPPYSEKKEFISSKIPNTGITHKSVPQWTWSTFECREWIMAVAIHTMNILPQKAEAKAMMFDGLGTTIYSTRLEVWRKIFGNVRGDGIYLMVLAMQNEDGALPESIKNGGWAAGVTPWISDNAEIANAVQWSLTHCEAFIFRQ